MADFDFNTLITDRSQADVDYLSELAARIVAGTASADDLDAFGTDLRGAYNASDMNRVGQAVAVLSQKLEALGFPVIASPRTDWTAGGIPTPEQLTTYLAGVAAVCAAIPLPEDARELPESMDALTFEGANAIEGALEQVRGLVVNTRDAAPLSGTLFCGMPCYYRRPPAPKSTAPACGTMFSGMVNQFIS